jgi:hypothetical protein
LSALYCRRSDLDLSTILAYLGILACVWYSDFVFFPLKLQAGCKIGLLQRSFLETLTLWPFAGSGPSSNDLANRLRYERRRCIILVRKPIAVGSSSKVVRLIRRGLFVTVVWCQCCKPHLAISPWGRNPNSASIAFPDHDVDWHTWPAPPMAYAFARYLVWPVVFPGQATTAFLRKSQRNGALIYEEEQCCLLPATLILQRLFIISPIC